MLTSKPKVDVHCKRLIRFGNLSCEHMHVLQHLLWFNNLASPHCSASGTYMTVLHNISEVHINRILLGLVISSRWIEMATILNSKCQCHGLMDMPFWIRRDVLVFLVAALPVLPVLHMVGQYEKQNLLLHLRKCSGKGGLIYKTFCSFACVV